MRMKFRSVPRSLLCICLSLPGTAYAATYWVSPTGTATWANCQSTTRLSGTAACSLATANSNATAGDLVYLRAGTYSTSVAPTKSGTCASSCLGEAGASMIVFSAYTGETPVILGQGSALDLKSVSWIKITGITFQNSTTYPFYLTSASYNEISYNFFVQTGSNYSTAWSVVGGNVSSPWSVHNWVHNNYISTAHNTDPCGQATDLIRVGMSEGNGKTGVGVSQDNYNTIENNYMEYGGHSIIMTNGKYEVVKNNIAHNEPFIPGCTNYKGSTSTSSLTISTSNQTLTTQTGLAYAINKPIGIIYARDYSQAMRGLVLSYDSTTGVLVVRNVIAVGSGTYSNWMLSQGNVAYYTNTASNNLFAHRNFAIGDADQYDKNWDLVEGNRIGFAGTNPGNGGSDGIDLESPSNIVRYNFVYGGNNGGIYFKWGNSDGAGTGGSINHVYNNTIYGNGTWNAGIYGDENVSYNGQGIGQLTYGGNTLNVVTNNIVYANTQGDICAAGWKYGVTTCTASSIDMVTNNWTTHGNGNPLFNNPDLTNPLSQNLISSAHGYTSGTPVPDLSLQAGSGAINGGTYLTTASGSGRGSTSLVVADASYFQDGTWGSDLARGVTMFPDVIAIGTVGNTAQIQSINYATNTITLLAGSSWNDGAPVWLYKKSDGVLVLKGNAPDIGAAPKATPPPTNLQGIVH